MEVTNIHAEIDRLKHRVATENISMKDIDILNMIDEYIKELEEKRIIAENSLNESFEEMIPGNVVIQNATIFIGTSSPPLQK